MTESDFVPPHFALPAPPESEQFVLAPLEVHHNEGDLDAWSSSIEHIHQTPGFAGHPWPDEPMTLERNEKDLQGHVTDRATRRGFTYTVLSVPDGDVIGCVYIYPSLKDGVDADIRSWVRASRAELDGPLYRTVSEWVNAQWPFGAVAYASREG